MILSMLNPRELSAMSRMDRNTRRLADDDAIWRIQYEKRFGFVRAIRSDATSDHNS
jgi:hypothetical protein